MTLLDKLKCLAIKAIAYKNISFMSCRKLVTKINKHILFAVNEHFTPRTHNCFTDIDGWQKNLNLSHKLSAG